MTTTVPVWSTIDSPIGELLLLGTAEGSSLGWLTGLYLAVHERCPAPAAHAVEDPTVFGEVGQQLEEYFDGSRQRFDLPLAPPGTAFQQAVWRLIDEVGHGETTTYGELARRLGRPRAARAVGAANGANPISIIIPCHRVVGADGSLTGYGWGTDRKDWLLDHERRAQLTTSKPPTPSRTGTHLRPSGGGGRSEYQNGSAVAGDVGVDAEGELGIGDGDHTRPGLGPDHRDVHHPCDLVEDEVPAGVGHGRHRLDRRLRAARPDRRQPGRRDAHCELIDAAR
ncbi:MAG: methylated-DNA--[protein]-cysteine S-methyltransferase [Actinomycetota bacterium]|nr:methylated-DNA--[protein]-cysteine S-methyltransferase [Actinomycetota bacterium]